MKRVETRRTVALLLAAYILGMTLGSAIIWAIPFFKNKEHILTIAADASGCWRTGSLPEGVQLYGMEYFLFDEQGRTVFSAKQFMLDSERGSVRSYLPALRKSGTLFRPAMFTVASSDGTPDHRVFSIVAGVTVTIDNGREYCSVLVRDLTDLDSSIIIFCVIYTMIFLAAGLCSYGIYRKERALNAMRRDLVANVSHELKTPITCIKARAEVLYDGLVRDETERRDYCRAILKESDLLEDMVMDILELSLITGQGSLYKWGAAPSYVTSGTIVKKLGTAAPPPGLGVGSTSSPEVIRLSLWGGDMLVLVSDGVVREETEDLLRSYDGENVKELASLLTAQAEAAGGEDDMTAAVLRLDELAP